MLVAPLPQRPFASPYLVQLRSSGLRKQLPKASAVNATPSLISLIASYEKLLNTMAADEAAPAAGRGRVMLAP
jgi:hypothetical protein